MKVYVVSAYRAVLGAAILGLAVGLWPAADAEDWPTFRHDNARSAVTAERLDAPFALEWVFVPPHAPQPAWPEPLKEKARARLDEAFHAVSAGDAVFFGSSGPTRCTARPPPRGRDGGAG